MFLINVEFEITALSPAIYTAPPFFSLYVTELDLNVEFAIVAVPVTYTAPPSPAVAVLSVNVQFIMVKTPVV